jgi:hypothetical protein
MRQDPEIVCSVRRWGSPEPPFGIAGRADGSYLDEEGARLWQDLIEVASFRSIPIRRISHQISSFTTNRG